MYANGSLISEEPRDIEDTNLTGEITVGFCASGIGGGEDSGGYQNRTPLSFPENREICEMRTDRVVCTTEVMGDDVASMLTCVVLLPA
jgi:hypothetical protein